MPEPPAAAAGVAAWAFLRSGGLHSGPRLRGRAPARPAGPPGRRAALLRSGGGPRGAASRGRAAAAHQGAGGRPWVGRLHAAIPRGRPAGRSAEPGRHAGWAPRGGVGWGWGARWGRARAAGLSWLANGFVPRRRSPARASTIGASQPSAAVNCGCGVPWPQNQTGMRNRCSGWQRGASSLKQAGVPPPHPLTPVHSLHAPAVYLRIFRLLLTIKHVETVLEQASEQPTPCKAAGLHAGHAAPSV